MKLFIIMIDNKYYHEYAYINKDHANRNAIHLGIIHPSRSYEVKEIDLPFAARSVCYVHTYYGFDYNFGVIPSKIEDVVCISNIYPCLNYAA